MLATAVVTGVAATGVSYFSGTGAPQAQSAVTAPAIAIMPRLNRLATPNGLLEAVVGAAEPSVAPLSDGAVTHVPATRTVVTEVRRLPTLRHSGVSATNDEIDYPATIS
jgi:hypothetical protein